MDEGQCCVSKVTIDFSKHWLGGISLVHIHIYRTKFTSEKKCLRPHNLSFPTQHSPSRFVFYIFSLLERTQMKQRRKRDKTRRRKGLGSQFTSSHGT